MFSSNRANIAALNPQPLPPRWSSNAWSLVALNPQPLPPQYVFLRYNSRYVLR